MHWWWWWWWWWGSTTARCTVSPSIATRYESQRLHTIGGRLEVLLLPLGIPRPQGRAQAGLHRPAQQGGLLLLLLLLLAAVGAAAAAAAAAAALVGAGAGDNGAHVLVGLGVPLLECLGFGSWDVGGVVRGGRAGVETERVYPFVRPFKPTQTHKHYLLTF